MNYIRECKKRHDDNDFSDYDIKLWLAIDKLRHEIGKDSIGEKALLSRAKDALDNEEYELASQLQLEIQEKVKILANMYTTYKKNLM